MKLNKTIIRNLIKESIDQFLSEETMAQQRDNAITQISNILIRLEQTNINAQDVLNAAKEAYEAGKPAEKTEMGPGNRKEKKWTDTNSLGEACGDIQPVAVGVTHDDEDHEGNMAKRQMYKTVRDAAQVFKMINPEDNYPAWLQSKMTKVADYIGVIKNYLEYDEVMGVPGNRKEKKWTDADHDKQEKIAKEIEKENPGIPKDEKMAYAGAQVNREKRKRSK